MVKKGKYVKCFSRSSPVEPPVFVCVCWVPAYELVEVTLVFFCVERNQRYIITVLSRPFGELSPACCTCANSQDEERRRSEREHQPQVHGDG